MESQIVSWTCQTFGTIGKYVLLLLKQEDPLGMAG